MIGSQDLPLKPLEWIGSCRAKLASFPVPVRKEIVHLVQAGEKPTNAKPLRGFGGAGVLEIVENHSGDTYRAVYTAKFTHAVFVLHAFQKKSKSGRATPKPDIDLIKRRFKLVAEQYREMYGDE
jgi:phage-related protein